MSAYTALQKLYQLSAIIKDIMFFIRYRDANKIEYLADLLVEEAERTRDVLRELADKIRSGEIYRRPLIKEW